MEANRNENNKKNYFVIILRFFWRVILYIITNPIFQLGLLIVFLNYFGANLFKHTKIGVFHNYTENIGLVIIYKITFQINLIIITK